MDAMLDHPLSQFKMANAEAFCALIYSKGADI